MFKIILISVVDITIRLSTEVKSPFSQLLEWFKSLPNSYKQGIIIGVIVSLSVALIIFIIKLPYKWMKKWWERRKERKKLRKAKYIIDYKGFYGDEIKIRHKKYKYVSKRKEEIEGKPISRDILKDAEDFLKSDKTVLILAGSGGMGKSRILIELAKKNPNLKFANTRGYMEPAEMEKLKSGLEQVVRKGQVIVFDDCQEYSGHFPIFLDTIMRKNVKIIVASRYLMSVMGAIDKRRLNSIIMPFRPMVNVSEIVTKEEDVANSIRRISQGNPAIAVMAKEHYKSNKTFKEVNDSFGLMKDLLKDLVRAGKEIGCHNPSLFLAELAVRAGLWETDEVMRQNFEMVKRVKQMGHIIAKQRGNKRLYNIVPDMLRDHIIREVFFEANEISPEFRELVTRVPPDDAVNIIRMLGIQFRETKKEIYKLGCTEVLKRFRSMNPRTRAELIIELGVEAYEWFGDYKLVTDILGDFCRGAEEFDSYYHALRAGVFYYQTGNLLRARECWKRALLLADEGPMKSLILHNLGLIEQDQGHYHEAEKLYNKSLKIVEQLGDKSGIAGTIGQIGILFYLQGEFKKAIKNYSKSLKLFKQIGNKYGIAKSLFQLGIIKQIKGNYREAEKIYQHSLKIAEELGDKSDMAKTLHQLGSIRKNQGKYTDAENLYKRSLKIKEELGDKSGIATSIHQLGMIKQDQGYYSEAEELYNKSLQIKKELGVKQGMSATLLQLGIIKQYHRNFTEAKKLYYQSLKISKKLLDKSVIAGTLHQLGMMKQAKRDSSKAEKLYQKSLEIAKELGDKSGMAKTLHQIGTLKQSYGDYPEAVSLYQKCIKIEEELGDKADIAGSLYQLGSIYFLEENYEPALKNFLIVAEIAEDLKHPNLPLALEMIEKVKNKLGETEFQKLYQKVLADVQKYIDKINL